MSRSFKALTTQIAELETKLRTLPASDETTYSLTQLRQLRTLAYLDHMSTGTCNLSRIIPLSQVHTILALDENALIDLILGNAPAPLPSELGEIPLRIFTVDELLFDYDGRQGHPLYLASSSYVVDATHHPLWSKRQTPSLRRNETLLPYFALYYQGDIKELATVGPILGRLIY